MGLPPDTDLSDADSKRDLWLSLLASAGPCSWFFLLSAVYAVADHECGSGKAVVAMIMTSVGMLGSLAAVIVGARLGLPAAASAPPPRQPRVRFMVHAGLALNGMSFVLLTGFLAPLIFLRPCE